MGNIYENNLKTTYIVDIIDTTVVIVIYNYIFSALLNFFLFISTDIYMYE